MTRVTIEQAIEIALARQRAGRLAEAEAIYRQVLAEVPDHADALQLLGLVAGQVGDLATACALLGRAIALEPAVAEHHCNLGEFLSRAGKWDEAIAALDRAIALKPGLAQAHVNRAGALRAQGRREDACAAYCRALELRDDDAVTHGRLGALWHELGHLEPAIAEYRRAIALGTEDAAIYNNLGTALNEAGQLEPAIAAIGRALELRPRYAEAYSNLGLVLHQAQRLDEAIAACRQAVALGGAGDEALAVAHNNLAGALRDAGALDAAISAYRRAIELRPENSTLYDNLIVTMHFSPGHDAQAILAETRRWAARFAAPVAAAIGPHGNDPAPDRRLRIGFISPDFRDHPAGQLVHPLFAHHDRAGAEFIGYADVRRPDAHTRSFQDLADGWRSIVGASDEEVARLVRDDQIDILVDLALHTAGNRLLVFARKPAPVQVSMLGMPSTTGLDTIAYRLTDGNFDPPGPSDGDYSETSIRLPRPIWCYEPPADAPPPGPPPALRNGVVTFGCLNQFAKVSEPALRVWIRILQALPGARLVLQSPPGSHLEPARALFQQGGIAPDRFEFVARVPRAEYLKRYLALDVCLDPFPYNGHTSTFDCLWMGVPVVTLAGRTGVGRAGVCILSNLGLAELVARAEQDYVAIAYALAGDLDRLAAMRRGLRGRMAASPLVDSKQYAADIEAAFRRMWQTWCRECS
jgi:predicted O-linked N-acetylglucosamine transferase (SPINDLY family)